MSVNHPKHVSPLLLLLLSRVLLLLSLALLVQANPRDDLVLTTPVSSSIEQNVSQTEANLVANKYVEENKSEPISYHKPRRRPPPMQASVQVYIVVFVSIIPAVVGATAWWIKKCRRRMISRRPSHNWNENIERKNHLKKGNIPIDHIASHIVRRAEMSQDLNNNSHSNCMIEKDKFIYNAYYRSQFIKSRRIYSIEIPRRQLELIEILGEGNFGQVWKAKAYQPSTRCKTTWVAVKTSKVNSTLEQQEELLKELDIMAQLAPHPNVVLLLGCCTENEPYYLLLEYVAGGKLLSHLRSHRTHYELEDARDHHHYGRINNNNNNNNTSTHEGTIGPGHCTLTPYDLINYAYQIAKGMEFISSHGIIHRDLAARNILIDLATNICKVADFGLSRSVRDAQIEGYEMKHGGQVPVRWMSPEALSMGVFTPKSDVWAYGVLLWEITTLGSTPYLGMSAQEVINYVRQGNVCPQPRHCADDLYELMKSAWAYKAENRLGFAEIKTTLGAMILEMKDNAGYIDLESFDDSLYYFETIDARADEKL